MQTATHFIEFFKGDISRNCYQSQIQPIITLQSSLNTTKRIPYLQTTFILKIKFKTNGKN
jgi:hypothetical protein